MDAEATTTFIFAHAQGWVLYAYAALALLLCWWSWRHYGPCPPGLAGRIARFSRIAAILLIIAALLGPGWQSTSVVSMPGRILVAVDQSASMAREDYSQGQPRLALAQELHQALQEELPRIQASLQWQAIGGVSGAIDPEQMSPADAVGLRSPLGSEVMNLARLYPADLLLVLSDFRVTEGPSLEVAAATLRGLELPVWTLGVGSQELDPELRIEEVQGNRLLAQGERQPFLLRFSARALDAQRPAQLRISAAGESLFEQEITLPEAVAEDNLHSFEERIELVVDDEDVDSLVFEIIQEAAEGEGLRHSLRQQVEVSTRRMQVLLLAHRPRYEMRYLQVALSRDYSVDVHAYLADGGWRLWSREGPDRLPVDAAALRDYDVIIIGDLSADDLPRSAQVAIVGQVREQGAGLVWIPGESGNVASFREQELGALLPVILPDRDTIAQGFQEDAALTLHRSPMAEERALFDPAGASWDELPYLRRIAAIEALREISQVWMYDQHDRPVVMSAPLSRGTAVFIGVDDTWRWRRNVGDLHLHRFHSQILRFASRARARGERPWRIDVSPRQAIPGQALRISLFPSQAEETSGPSAVTLQLRREDDEASSRLVNAPRLAQDRGYQAAINAPGVGSWQVEVLDGLAAHEVHPAQFSVHLPGDELRDPRYDPQAQDLLSESTGGRAFRDLQELISALPPLARQEQRQEEQSLWDRWPWLLLLVILLGLEWGLRRRHRLP